MTPPFEVAKVRPAYPPGTWAWALDFGDILVKGGEYKPDLEETARLINEKIEKSFLGPMRKAVEALKKTEHPDWLCAGWHEVDDIQGLGFVREDCNCYVGEAEDGLRSALGVK